MIYLLFFFFLSITEYSCCLPDRAVNKAATGTASGGVSTQRYTQAPSQSVAQTPPCAHPGAPGQPSPAAGSARLVLVLVPAFRARPGPALSHSTPLAGAREALGPLSCRPNTQPEASLYFYPGPDLYSRARSPGRRTAHMICRAAVSPYAFIFALNWSSDKDKTIY